MPPVPMQLRVQVPANHKGTTAASRVMAGDSVRQHSAPLNLASDGASVTPMSFLDDVEDQVLLQLLKGEHPQTIAVVLASIRPEQAGRILPQLDARTQTETLHRIGRLDGFPDAAITEVAEHFKQRIVEQTNLQTASPGRNALDAILAAMPAQASSQSNHSVATAVQPTQAPPPAVFPSADEPQQDLAHKIRLAEHTLPDTIDEGGDDHQHHPSVRPASSRGTASDRSTSGGRNNPSPLHSTDSIHNHLQTMAAAKLCEALGRVDTRVAMLALCGLPSHTADAALAILPKAEAKRVRQAINSLGSLNLRDIDDAKEAVARASMAKRQRAPLAA